MEFRAGDRVYIPELSEWDQENYEYGWDYGIGLMYTFVPVFNIIFLSRMP